MKNIPHAIQYQGSKRNLAPEILRYVPMRVDRLVEPFAGSAAISVAAAARGMAKTYAINDLNQPLVELLRLIIEHPVETAAFYEHLWSEQHADSLAHYYKVREDFNRTQDPRLFLYLLARCVKGSVRYNSDGFFNQSPDKRRHGTRPDTMRSNIFGVSALLKGKTHFSSLDYREILSKTKKSDLVYYIWTRLIKACVVKEIPVIFREFRTMILSISLKDMDSRGIAYIVSYDGRRGDKVFGELLPEALGLTRVELAAGRSSQSTLLGRAELTFESLYLSRSLANGFGALTTACSASTTQQYVLLEPSARYA